MATYFQSSTITAISQAVTLSSDGSTTSNLVVPANSKATVRVFVSADISTGTITSASASFAGSGGFGTIASASISSVPDSETVTIDQVVLGEGTHVLSVSRVGTSPGTGSVTARIIGILETNS